MSELVLHTSKSIEEIEKDFEDHDVYEHITAALQEALDYEQGKKCPCIVVEKLSLSDSDGEVTSA